MPLYRFEIEGDTEHDAMDLPNDDAAWSEIVTWCGEILKDVDGKLPAQTDIRLRVWNAERLVARIELVATRCAG